ncbi:hypothetical protein NDU88_005400 [Pleurodeles waltl]|uniref:Uncharacterized protein n=1 Tax=Pleurodeles waltl TaxID=8319 RepID=A0AAV7LMS5_PLEWA|nr:hypothetical protein NDU88_005400 [Pleurodeles waltl]
MEAILNQILLELRERKLLHSEAYQKTIKQLEQINSSITQLVSPGGAKDMSIMAARCRNEFVALIDDFKRQGAPAGIVQQSKLKVLYKGQTVDQAQELLRTIKKGEDKKGV